MQHRLNKLQFTLSLRFRESAGGSGRRIWAMFHGKHQYHRTRDRRTLIFQKAADADQPKAFESIFAVFLLSRAGEDAVRFPSYRASTQRRQLFRGLTLNAVID